MGCSLSRIPDIGASTLAKRTRSAAVRQASRARYGREREQFKALLLANPNYFGTVKQSSFKSVLSLQLDTTYEEIGCVGFQPQLSQLEAVVYIKQQLGYGGDLCSKGSQEFVRFYLSYDDGMTWQDRGLVSFAAYDIPGDKPLEYDVTLKIDPQKLFCFASSLPKVRAILSWNQQPTPNSPNFLPVWGNVVDAYIQIAPAMLFPLGGILEAAKAEVPKILQPALDLTQTVPLAKSKMLTPIDLHKLYKNSKVPAHRYLFSEITKIIANPELVNQLPVKELAVNLGQVITQLGPINGNTLYEELDCVGFDPNLGALVGIITVKLQQGYSGGLCYAGSQEYVAFWVDWGDGAGWTYTGTASVNVHDITRPPGEELEYAVFLPVNIAKHLLPCGKGAKIAKVRAVLSWQVPPSTVDPNASVVWGNSDETLISLPPGNPVQPGTANIAIIGGIGIPQIDTALTGLTLPNAFFANFGPNRYADPWDHTRQCPFGGLVDVHGYPTQGMKYRVSVRKVGSNNVITLTDTIYTVDMWGNTTARNPDLNGFFDYLDPSLNILNTLAYWNSVGDDLWELRLQIADNVDNVQNSTPWYRIQLDNTAPELPTQLTPPTIDIHIDSGGDCKDFPVATEIDGRFIALDTHFGVWSLATLPSNLVPPPNTPRPDPIIPSTQDTSISPGGYAWKLITTGMLPCGYVVQLQVWDRSIVGSQPGSHNWNHAEVGFCLRAP